MLETNLVTIERFRDLPEALLAKGKLESAGIRCFLADAELVRTDWLWSNAIGNMRLQVRPEDAKEALEVLREPPPEIFLQDEVGEVYQQPRCPQCESRDVAFESIDRSLSYALMFLTLAYPFKKNNWKCHACGAEWVED
ncbi:MAG TPA: hypothetical protein VFI95_02955 [Terriglobales bacterium]|nr:hypothetical protein [Terriglobales bacterium]